MKRLIIAMSLLCTVACSKGGSPTGVTRIDGGVAVVVVDDTVTAKTLDAEKEPNDEASAGQVIALPGGARGAIDKADDRDYYTFAVARPGMLTAALSGAADADLILELIDDSGKRLIRSDNGPAGKREGFPNFIVQPGKYHLRVTEFVKKKKGGAPARTTPSESYALEAHLGVLPAEGDEVEPNGEAAFAGDLILGGASKGFLGWRRDKDYWRLPLSDVRPDEGVFIDVDAIEGVAIRLQVLDGTEQVLVSRQAFKNQPVAVRNLVAKKGEPHYFVVISCGVGNIEEPYTLRAGSSPFRVDDEAEPNDTTRMANAITESAGQSSGTREGYLVSGDTDYFRIASAGTARVLRVSVQPPPYANVVLTVVDEADMAIVPAANVGKRGKKESLSNVPISANQTAFVKLSLKGVGSETERYRLQWSVIPGQVAPAPAPPAGGGDQGSE